MGSGGTLAEPLETNHGLQVKHPPMFCCGLDADQTLIPALGEIQQEWRCQLPGPNEKNNIF